MSFWTLDRLGHALAGVASPDARLPGGQEPLGAVSTDTRTIQAGDIFVALHGETFDAHEFLGQAKAKGAKAFVVDRAERTAGIGAPVFLVQDSTEALGSLGRYRRLAWGRPVIAVAGSNGKTTTKEFIRAALDQVFTVHATQGNLNNQVGVPQTLLAIPDDADVAVVEIGTNHPGEVELLRKIVEPELAVVTSIGEEHLEGLVNLDGVLREECAVFRGADVAVTPANQPEVAALARTVARSTIEAGLDAGDFQPLRWSIANGNGSADFSTDGEDARLELKVRGIHNLRNAVLSLAVARACGVPLDKAARGISMVQPLNMRGVWQDVGAVTLINDAYNANPASMREAIALLDGLPKTRQRVLVLGGMRELGTQSAAMHDEIARCAVGSSADIVAGIGDFATALRSANHNSDRVVTGSEIDDLWPQLRARLSRDAVVLLKASRGVRLERLVPIISEWALQ